MMEVIFSGIFSLIFIIFFVLIILALLYWVVKSAINDSELVTLLRDLNQKLNQLIPIDGNESNSDEEITNKSTFECPACNSRIPLDSSICPECGIVFQDE